MCSKATVAGHGAGEPSGRGRATAPTGARMAALIQEQLQQSGWGQRIPFSSQLSRASHSPLRMAVKTDITSGN